MIIAARKCLGKRCQRWALPGLAAISGWADPLRTAFSGQATNAAITPAPEVVADVVKRDSVGMTTLRLILGDHLTRSVSALSDINIVTDVVLMVEAAEETRYVRHHRQKIAFILSAMRHFANDLRNDGVNVDYVKLDDLYNTGSFTGGRAIERHCATRMIVTEPGEWRVMATSIFIQAIRRKSRADLRHENQRISNYDNGSNPSVDHWFCCQSE